ncbi:MAG: hypothetical protein WCO23_01130 [bacterium]
MESNQPIDKDKSLSTDLFEGMQKDFDRKYKRDYILVVSLLIVIFLIPIFLMVTFRSNFEIGNFSLGSKKQDFNFSALVSDQSLEKKTGESFNVKITEKQLAEMLGVDSPDFPLQKASLKINSDKIIISGRNGTSLLALKIDIGLLPKVDNGKVTLEIVSIESLGVVAPKQITDAIQPKLAKMFADIYSVPPNITISNINLEPKTIIIVGTIK